MKSTFKKAFGVILGVYAGCVAVEIISKFGKTYLKVEKPAEKETDENEKESNQGSFFCVSRGEYIPLYERSVVYEVYSKNNFQQQ